MGNEIFIKEKRGCVKPLKNRLEAIKNVQPHYSEGMQKFHRNGELPEYVLSRIKKNIKAHIWLDKERHTICIGERTARFL